MTQPIGELNPPNRLMLTPGPSSMDPRVYRALATPLVGHVDPWFRGCMDDTQVLLRQIFQTENRITMPLSASGSGGIEASVVNTLEEGDEAIIAVNGVFSDRMAVIAGHTPAKVTKVEAPYGQPVDPEDVRRAGKGRKIKIVGFAHGETSSGVLTDIDSFRKVADELGALLVVDTVASLAAVPLHVDHQRIDICFSGTQKAISAPAGHVADHREPARRRSLPQPQNESAELVLRPDHRDELLGQGPAVSSHPAGFADLRPARSDAHRDRRRSRGALGAPPHESTAR